METEAKTAEAAKRNWMKIGLIAVGVCVTLFFALGAFSDDILKWDANRRAENYDKMLADSRAEYSKALAADTYGGSTPEETLDLLIAALEKSDIALVIKYYPVNIQKEVGEKYALRTPEMIKTGIDSFTELKKFGEKTCTDTGCTIEYTYTKEGAEKLISADFSRNSVTQVWKIEDPY